MVSNSPRSLNSRFPLPSDVFQVLVTLADIEPPIWRRLLIPQDVLLPRLHGILQIAMGWTDSHLHQFQVGGVLFGEPDPEDELNVIDYRRIALNQLGRHAGSSFVYEYDFGDSWEHVVEVEDELPVEVAEGRIPGCVAGARSCPPEDVGGAPGYARFLEAIANPADEEHASYQEWAGARFDPEEFDIDRVNAALEHFVRTRAARPKR